LLVSIKNRPLQFGQESCFSFISQRKTVSQSFKQTEMLTFSGVKKETVAMIVC